MKKEEFLQMAVTSYISLQYPKVLMCHIANERRTSPQQGAKLKKLGVKSGMPDTMIFKQRGLFCGLYIELKIKPNKPQPNQIEVMKRLDENGWCGKVCYDFESAKEFIDLYLN